MSQYPAMKRIGFSAHVIDDNLSSAYRRSFLRDYLCPFPARSFYRMIAHYLQGKSHNARAMLNEHQLAGDSGHRPGKIPQWVALKSKTARCL